MWKLLTGFLMVSMIWGSGNAGAAAVDQAKMNAFIRQYVQMVSKDYADCYNAALDLEKAVDALLDAPSEITLAKAKEAWLAARVPYEKTEAYRFYQGPIDMNRSGPGTDLEGQLNAWPLNDAYIDYVRDNPKAGIINDINISIDEDTLVKKNAAEDEADVTTGYHAVEFLLWGQPLDPVGVGRRQAADYFPGDPFKQRRRNYLKVVTALLVKDLKLLADAWAPGQDNYAASFLKLDYHDALRNILTGMANLSGFELASERIGDALISGDRHDQQSCFSDSTHKDYLYSVKGIADIYYAGLDRVIADVDPALTKKIDAQFKETKSIAEHFDFTISAALASPKGSPQRQHMEQLMKALQDQADLLKKLGSALGVKVSITVEKSVK